MAIRISKPTSMMPTSAMPNSIQSLLKHTIVDASMPGANTRSSIHAAPFPLTIARGESAFLFSVDGHEYLDFLGEFSAGIYGHSSTVIKEAVIEALSKGWNFGTKNIYEDQLARVLVQRFSNSMELIRFCNSGTEANMMAVGAAINFTRKKRVSPPALLLFWCERGDSDKMLEIFGKKNPMLICLQRL
jgi:glutamate-1-semialdehyde aminotransferase